jgi:collagenase-like PrtC family protease
MPGLKFSVAACFEEGFLDGLSGLPVSELFGKLPSDPVGGGRASFMLSPLSARALRKYIESANKKGIGFNYLLNAACMDNTEYTRKGQKALRAALDFAESIGAGSVTISLPSILPVIKRHNPSLRVRVGVYARVDCVAKAKFWEEMGADCITLESISVNRNFRLLTAIRKAVTLELQLIANSNCLMFCPLSGQHMVNLSHASQKGHRSGGFMIDWCALKCSYLKLKEPTNFLRSEFIRPEDLGQYRILGYNNFKILERGAPGAAMLKRIRAYAEGSFDGNLLDIIQPYGYKEKPAGGIKRAAYFWKYFFRPGDVKLTRLMKIRGLALRRGLIGAPAGEPVYIDNIKLDGFLEGFRDKDCRTTDCSGCGHCDRYTNKAVRVEENLRAEMLGEYGEIFDDMDSGWTWGIGGRRAGRTLR